MARPAGFEPATLGLEGRCSIQMSYGRRNLIITLPRVQNLAPDPYYQSWGWYFKKVEANGLQINTINFAPTLKIWSGWRDSNSRPTAPKAVALPGCATPRNLHISKARNHTLIKNNRQLNNAYFLKNSHLPVFG
jgi:hypothetical protein